jgi:hypothetical protein
MESIGFLFFVDTCLEKARVGEVSSKEIPILLE